MPEPTPWRAGRPSESAHPAAFPAAERRVELPRLAEGAVRATTTSHAANRAAARRAARPPRQREQPGCCQDRFPSGQAVAETDAAIDAADKESGTAVSM